MYHRHYWKNAFDFSCLRKLVSALNQAQHIDKFILENIICGLTFETLVELNKSKTRMYRQFEMYVVGKRMFFLQVCFCFSALRMYL